MAIQWKFPKRCDYIDNFPRRKPVIRVLHSSRFTPIDLVDIVLYSQKKINGGIFNTFLQFKLDPDDKLDRRR